MSLAPAPLTPHSHLADGQSLHPLCPPHHTHTWWEGRACPPAPLTPCSHLAGGWSLPPVPLTLHSHLVGRKNLSLCAAHTHTSCITCPFTNLLRVSGEQVLSKCLWHELP